MQMMALPLEFNRKKGATRKGKIMYAHHSVLIDQDACTQVNHLLKLIACRRKRLVKTEYGLSSACRRAFSGTPSLANMKSTKIMNTRVTRWSGYTLENRAIVNFLNSAVLTFFVNRFP